MANFITTHWVVLLDASADGTSSLSWSGSFAISEAAAVIDNSPTGLLTPADTFLGASYTGFYLDIGGQFFGVFKTGQTFAVPFNATIFDIGASAALAAKVTTLHDTALDGAANCFLTGTRIATPGAERAIEALRPGDPVLTATGGTTRVRWLWRRDLTQIVNAPDPARGGAVVRISAGALGPRCPAADLTVTADHALLLEGLLVNAGALVNGSSIRLVARHDLPPRVSFWHVETDRHDLILAQGAAAETFVATVARHRFDGHAAYVALYGGDRLVPEMALPRVTTARQLPAALRGRLGITRAAGLHLYNRAIPTYPARFNRGPTPLEAAPSDMENSNGW